MKTIAELVKRTRQPDVATRKPEPAARAFLLRQAHDPSPAEGRPSHDVPLQASIGHDFSRIPVYPQRSAEPEHSCPLASSSPRYCPFGGACHTCPRVIPTGRAQGELPDNARNLDRSKDLRR